MIFPLGVIRKLRHPSHPWKREMASMWELGFIHTSVGPREAFWTLWRTSNFRSVKLWVGSVQVSQEAERVGLGLAQSFPVTLCFLLHTRDQHLGLPFHLSQTYFTSWPAGRIQITGEPCLLPRCSHRGCWKDGRAGHRGRSVSLGATLWEDKALQGHTYCRSL
jgi:hypothetical protein